MKQTDNLGLTIYDETDRFNVTGSSNSLNKNMQTIDEEFGKVQQTIDESIEKILPDIQGELDEVRDDVNNYMTPDGNSEDVEVPTWEAFDSLKNDVYGLRNGISNYVPKTDYSPTAKTDAMTQPVGKDANGKLWTAPTGGGSSGGSPVAIDETLTLSGAAADAKAVGALFDAIQGEMDNLHPLEIQSFTVNPNIVEKGSTVTAQAFSYSVNRTSAETKIDGTAVTGGSASRSDALSEDKTYTLTATLKGVTKTKTASIRFVAPIYYGVSESYTLENETVLSLNRLLKTSKSLSFTVNAASGQYILFAIPVSMGAPTFNVGGFEGGFTLVGTFEFTNSSGHSEDYSLYRSVNSGLGSTKVSVS